MSMMGKPYRDADDPTLWHQDFVETIEVETPPFKCKTCGRMSIEHPTIDVRDATSIFICQERAMKWKRVEPGTVIPAGQPYRWEALELPQAWESVAGEDVISDHRDWFVDSSWKPPLVLPTEPTWGFLILTEPGVVNTTEPLLWKLSDGVFRGVGTARGSYREVHPDAVHTFIPLTDEQVARIEAAR